MVSLTVVPDEIIYYMLRKSRNTFWVELIIGSISSRGPNEFRGVRHRLCGEKIIIAEHDSIQSCLQSCTVFTRYYWRTNEQTSFAWRISFRQIITHNFNSNHYKNTNFTGLRCLSINEHIYSLLARVPLRTSKD